MKALKSLIFCLIIFLGVNSYAKAAPLSQISRTFYVMEGGTGDCSDWGASACGLQTALTNANPGDQVWVATGTYKPTNTDPYPRDATFELKSGVAIYGGFPAAGGTLEQRDWVTHSTTLSGDIGNSGDSTDNSYHVVIGNGVDATAILDGFTISGGIANGSGWYIYGGGMFNTTNSSPTLTNIIFSANSASSNGGGMYNYSGSNPTLINVAFSGNSAYAGGGMANNSSSPTLTNVAFSANPAAIGGGMCNESSSPKLTNVTFSTNPATVYGGGMYNSYSSPELNNATFSGNSAINGGGMYNLFYSNPMLTNVTFSANPATSGGGMFNDSSEPTLTNVTFSSNTASNDGGGMSNNNHSHPTLTNVTFFDNTAKYDGGGMANWNSSSTVTNAIFWGNTPVLDQIKIDPNSSATITYSDIQNWSGGAGNINTDPLLGPLANNGGFTQTHAIGEGSPAIDAAYPASCPATDQRGFPRPIDGNGDDSPVCDMGAYEFGSSADGFELTLEIVGSGVVAKNPEELKYALGEVVNLTATANPGWTFSSWSGDASGTTNPLPVTMSRHKSITANFTSNYKTYLPLILRN